MFKSIIKFIEDFLRFVNGPKIIERRYEEEFNVGRCVVQVNCINGQTFFKEFIGEARILPGCFPSIYSAKQKAEDFIKNSHILVHFVDDATQTTYFNLQFYSMKIIKEESHNITVEFWRYVEV